MGGILLDSGFFFAELPLMDGTINDFCQKSAKMRKFLPGKVGWKKLRRGCPNTVKLMYLHVLNVHIIIIHTQVHNYTSKQA